MAVWSRSSDGRYRSATVRAKTAFIALAAAPSREPLGRETGYL
jgi:hypothetical protein